MPTIVLAAGPGTRLRPLTTDRPKAMLSPAGMPLLEGLLRSLQALGETDVRLVVGHGARVVQNFVGDGDRFGVRVTYVHQDAQLGPGHALLQAKDDLKEFCVVPGDAWIHENALARLRNAKGSAMMEVPDARSGRHGVPVTDAGHVTDLLEAHEAGAAAMHFSGGAYKLHGRIFEQLHSTQHSLRDAIRNDIRTNGPYALVHAEPGEYVDVIEVEDLLTVQDRVMPALSHDIQGTVEEGAVVQGPVHLGKGSTIRSGTIVQGPAFIGQNCEVGPAAVLLPQTAIRNHVRIEPCAVLGNCIIASNVMVGTHARVTDAVIDNGARLGPTCIVHDRVIIGADAELDARAMARPGAVIGRQAKIASGRVVDSVPDGGRAV